MGKNPVYKSVYLSFWCLIIILLTISCDTMSEEREQWLIEKAQEGDMESQYIIALSVSKFRSVNEETRKKYLESLVENEYIPAIRYKARRTKNIHEKIKWLEKAALKGDGISMYLLYEVYSHDITDEALAEMWLRKSAETGYSDARDKVRKIDNIKVGMWRQYIESIQLQTANFEGTSLAKISIISFTSAKELFLGWLGCLLNFIGTWWIGLLLLLGQFLFIALFFVVCFFYYQLDASFSVGEDTFVGWLTPILVLWGGLSCILSNISNEFAYNVGRIWLAEGTFGFWAKLAVGLSWTVLIFILLAILMCLMTSLPNKRMLRLLMMAFFSFYSYFMGAYLSLIVLLCVALMLVYILMSSGDIISSTSHAPRILFDNIVVGVNGVIKRAKNIGGNKLEDEDGNTYKHTGYNEYEKE